MPRDSSLTIKLVKSYISVKSGNFQHRKFPDYNIYMPAIHRLRPLHEDAKPPQEVRFTELRVEPWPDARRVRVHVTLTPFEQYPNLEAVLARSAGEEVSRAAIIETAENRIVFTLHIRAPEAAGTYWLTATITYPDFGTVDEQTISFELGQPTGGDA